MKTIQQFIARNQWIFLAAFVLFIAVMVLTHPNGFTIGIDPVAFSVGSLEIRWYGIMYVVAISIGLAVAVPYGLSLGVKMSDIQNLIIVGVPAGIIGGRLYYVIQQPLGPYLREPWRILAINEGGMAFFGAIFAVLIILVIMTRKNRLTMWKVLDGGALFATLGQFFGRWGNIINGDVLGAPTDLRWGFIYTNPNNFFVPNLGVAYHPAAVYEAFANVVVFSILWPLRYKFRPGTLCFMYLFLHCAGQFIVFFMRDDVNAVFLGLKQAQVTALVVAALTAVGWVWYRKTNQGVGPPSAADTPPAI
ncbi:MAG: prolipoprotein diacylglyceryl transferase [Dehalococcoidia bacterium]|nr:prolipoprotein diacylglyceryl transferase [Dehalococcoidia bacterium]